MHRFKSAILEKLKNCLNGTFEPVHEIQNFFWPKVFFWSIMKVPFRKNIHNMPQGPPNPGFMQEKVQKGDFLKKPSWELKFFCCFRFLWISQRPGTLNWKWLVFLLSKILYKKCEYHYNLRSTDGLDYISQMVGDSHHLGTLSTILQHFTHTMKQWHTAARQWQFALRDLSCRQKCHLSTPSHPRVPPGWPYCRQAQCGRWFTV